MTSKAEIVDNERQRKLLRTAMLRTDGKRFRGARCIISFLGSNGTRCFLSGNPYIGSAFHDRAYELGETQAKLWIKRYKLVLRDAIIHK